jgi:hypothetical protein
MKKLLSFAFRAALLSAVVIPVSLGAEKDKAASKDKPYKLDLCLVSDEKLGEMGDPFVTTYKGQEIKMCCKACNKDFTKNPDKYLKKLAEASKGKK